MAAVLRASAFVLLAFVLPGLAPRRAWRLMDVGHRLLAGDVCVRCRGFLRFGSGQVMRETRMTRLLLWVWGCRGVSLEVIR